VIMAVGGAIGALIRRYTEEHGEEIVEAIKNQDYSTLPGEG